MTTDEKAPKSNGPALTGPQHFRSPDEADEAGSDDPNDPAVNGVGAATGVSGSSDAGVSDSVSDASTPEPAAVPAKSRK